MASSDIEVVRRVLELSPETLAFVKAGGDFAMHPSARLWDQQCVLEELDEVPDAQAYEGLEGVGEYFRRLFELWDELAYEPGKIEAGPQGVLVECVTSGRSHSGVPTSMTVHQAYRVRDGRITWVKAFLDRDRAASEVGLRVQPRSDASEATS